MIRRIQEHNQLNGSAFPALEFLLIAAAASLVAIGEGRQGTLVIAGLLAGIAVNYLVVVGSAAAARMHDHPGAGLLKLLDTDERHRLA